MNVNKCSSFPLTLLLNADMSQAFERLRVGMKWIDVYNITPRR